MGSSVNNSHFFIDLVIDTGSHGIEQIGNLFQGVFLGSSPGNHIRSQRRQSFFAHRVVHRTNLKPQAEGNGGVVFYRVLNHL